jgi:hypothetical protein
VAVLQIALAIVSTACFVALTAYLFMAAFKRGDTLYLLGINGRLSLKQNAFVGLAAVAMLVCFFNGAEAMLFWLPSDWGSLDEDGDFVLVRTSIASVFTLLAFGWLEVPSKAASNAKLLQIVSDEAKWLREIVASVGHPLGSDSIRRQLTEKLESLELGRAPRHPEAALLPDDERILMYRQLIAAVDGLSK